MYPAALLDPENTTESLACMELSFYGAIEWRIRYISGDKRCAGYCFSQAGRVWAWAWVAVAWVRLKWKNLLMQTDTSKSSSWGFTAEHWPMIPFVVSLLFTFFRDWETGSGFFFKFLSTDGFGRCFCSSTKHVFAIPRNGISHITAASHLVQKEASSVCFRADESWRFP